MDFTRTVQKNEEEWWVDQLFDGTQMVYPLPIVPRRAQPGDWVYTIYRGRIVGRNKIKEIEIIDEENINVGTESFAIKARCIIHLECPGERAPYYIPRKGHQGIRYDSVPEWK